MLFFTSELLFTSLVLNLIYVLIKLKLNENHPSNLFYKKLTTINKIKANKTKTNITNGIGNTLAY